jgi:hypothetical protein
MTGLALEVKRKYQSVHFALLLGRVVAGHAFLDRVALFPNVFSILEVVMAVTAFNALIFRMEQMRELDRLIELSAVTVGLDHDLFGLILGREYRYGQKH